MGAETLWPSAFGYCLFGEKHMLGWLKRKFSGSGEIWPEAQQPPGKPFPFPKGAALKPKEEVTLALPGALIADHEQIGSVLLCDDDAESALNPNGAVEWPQKTQEHAKEGLGEQPPSTKRVESTLSPTLSLPASFCVSLRPTAAFRLNEQAGVYYVRLKPGMRFSLAKSCEMLVVADDNRPRQFQIMRPETKSPNQAVQRMRLRRVADLCVRPNSHPYAQV